MFKLSFVQIMTGVCPMLIWAERVASKEKSIFVMQHEKVYIVLSCKKKIKYDLLYFFFFLICLRLSIACFTSCKDHRKKVVKDEDST